MCIDAECAKRTPVRTTDPNARTVVSTAPHIGRRPRFANTKIRGELGLAFRPIETTIAETMADLGRWGHLPAA